MVIGKKVKLRDKRVEDAKDDYVWRTDLDLARLDAVPWLTLTFPQYLSVYISELHQASSIKRQFAIDTLDGKHIGNCLYYDIDETKGEAELGIMVGNHDYQDKGYGTDAVNTLLSHIFRQTDLKRIYLKTLELNMRAQRCFQKCGFIPCGRLVRDGYNFVLMEIHRKQWERQPQPLEARASLRIKAGCSSLTSGVESNGGPSQGNENYSSV